MPAPRAKPGPEPGERAMPGGEAIRPRVSVIVPVYDDQAGVEACVAALGRQTWPAEDLEVIVVDNDSPESVRIDTTSAFELRVLRCPVPGAYAARNAGIEAASGDVLAFTDADCIPDPGWIENGVAALFAGAKPRVIGGEVRLRLSERPTAVELYQGLAGFDQQENIEKRGFTVTANLFATRETVAAVGPFATGLLSGGDLEWSRRARAASCEIVFAPDVVVETLPRRTLRSAARQARRVAGGRRVLRSAGTDAHGEVGPRRGALASLRLVLGHSGLGRWDRLRVLSVATFLYFVRIAESMRLGLGGQPERR